MLHRISLFFFFACTLFSNSLTAQIPGAGRNGGSQNMNMGHFYGKVVDANTGKAIEAASVQLLQNKLDSVSKKRKDQIVDGMLTNKRGEFSLENLAVLANYKLKITAIGFKPYEQKVFFNMNGGGSGQGDMSSMLSGIDKDLGNIKMESDVQQMKEVVVTATRPQLTLAIDRKIFNVEKNLTSIGGTAVDVMKNVPGLNVDIDGNVTMRNAEPQIFVDGRPTTMTLEQIPADAIATVELITNPSAKFDASGGGAGILNVVLKKNRKAGYNGNIRSSIDSRYRPSFGGDINIKEQKINLFASGNLGFRKTITTSGTDRIDYLSSSITHLNQDNKPIGTGVFGFGRLGMDIFLDNRNTLTLSGNYSRGGFDNNDRINILRDSVYSSYTINEYGLRNSASENDFRNLGTSISFKHNFAKANKSLTADLNYNYSKNENQSDFQTQYFNMNATPKTPLTFERTKGGGWSKFLVGQIDYDNPITDKIKIEAGARIAVRKFYSFNDNYYKTAETDPYTILTNLNNQYEFTDRVMAAYGTYSQQVGKKFSYQLGLRIESSRYEGTLISKNQQFSNEFPFSVFPSVFATYKINDKQDMQLNYSRKINRPNFFQLIPFIDYSDSLNLSKGNPDLIPEFTNLMELSYQNQLATGHSLLTTLYFKNTDNLITRYQYQLQNPNFPAKPDTVVMTTYANASRSYSYGLEFTIRNKIATWWDVNTNFNFYHTYLKAGNVPGGVDNDQFSWFVKMNNSFKLPSNFSIQLSGDYQAKTLVAPGGGGNNRGGGGGRGGGMMFGGGGNVPTAQGYIKPIYSVDIAIRKDFLKNNAASLTLQVNDIFRTRINATHSESAFFVQDVERLRDPQVFRLNFNWRFGKVDATLFKRKNLRSEQESMQNGMQGMN